ncbi:granzyme B-like isoform X2 [Neoarius graeffei]|nr:granzyme B-like isoform X2 [Neoarius graeffei]
MVSVQINRAHVCGGMLIKEDYVLTTAHCVDAFTGNDKLEVVLGAHNITQKEPQQQRIHVQKYIKYPCYKKNKRPDDIMLLKLKTAAKLNNAVKVLDLPKKNENIPARQKCSIAGWGKTSQNSSWSSVLQEVTLVVQFNFECKKIWNDTFDNPSMICTVPDGKKAFCQGDSGSPLICGNAAEGIAAYTFRENCLNRKYPEVYMKISYFNSWIKQVIG